MAWTTEDRRRYAPAIQEIWGSQTRFQLAGSTPAGYSPT